MAQIKIVNGEIYNVKETKEYIDNIMCHPECIDTGIINLMMPIEIPSWEEEKTTKIKYNPVSFIVRNIIMYY